MNKKIVAIIEARMGSTRLPGKVLLEVRGIQMLERLVNRIRSIPLIDEVVLATTSNQKDNVLEKFTFENNIKCHRGSEHDVLSRVIGAGLENKADIIVEITGDCPIIDTNVIKNSIDLYLNNQVDYVSNVEVRSYPDGMDVQVYSLDALIKSSHLTKDRLDREHVTLFIRKHPELFTRIDMIAPKELHWPELGLTLDEHDDFLLLSKIINELEPANENFSCHEVINYLKKNEDLLKINSNIKRKGSF